MKLKRSIYTLLILCSSTLFLGCNAKENYAVTSDTKRTYTESERVQIYALAEKYELEIIPMSLSANQPLKNISEIEAELKEIIRQNNTPIPLVKNKDGSYQTKSQPYSSRIKTRAEEAFLGTSILDGSHFFIRSTIIVQSHKLPFIGVTFKDTWADATPGATSAGYIFSFGPLIAEDPIGGSTGGIIVDDGTILEEFSFRFKIKCTVTELEGSHKEKSLKSEMVFDADGYVRVDNSVINIKQSSVMIYGI